MADTVMNPSLSTATHEPPSRRGDRLFNGILTALGIVALLAGAVFIRMDETLVAEGYVLPEGETRLFAPEGGLVREIHFRERSIVGEGDTLLSLDTRAIESRIRGLKQELAGLEDELAQVSHSLATLRTDPVHTPLLTAPRQTELIRERLRIQRSLLERLAGSESVQIISELMLERERMALIEAERQLVEAEHLQSLVEADYLGQLQSALETRRDSLRLRASLIHAELEALGERRDEMAIKAPIDGEITLLEIRHPGMRVEAGDLLIKLSPLDAAPRVRATVGQRNIDLLSPGVPVRMESMVFDAPLEGYITGHIDRIAPEPQRDTAGSSAEPRYEIMITVEDSPYPLVWGSTIRAEILLGRRSLLEIFLRTSPGRRSVAAPAPPTTP